MNKKNIKNLQKGQALLTLLFFVVIAISVITAAVFVLAENSLSTSKSQEGSVAYYAAESGVENAILQLERNPGYTGEIVQVDTATVTVTVTQGSSITILSVAKEGNSIRKIQVQAVFTNNMISVSSWKEVY